MSVLGELADPLAGVAGQSHEIGLLHSRLKGGDDGGVKLGAGIVMPPLGAIAGSKRPADALGRIGDHAAIMPHALCQIQLTAKRIWRNVFGMTTTQATAPAGALTEIQVQWGEDTFCVSCLCDLPAGAPAYPDGDGRYVCTDCKADDSDAWFILVAVAQLAAETSAEYPTASPYPQED